MKLSSLLRLASRNTARHRVRTALTTSMVLFGVALLVLGMSWIGGVLGGSLESATAMGGHVRVAVPRYTEREELMPLEANIPKVAPLVDLLSRQPGVVAVEPRIQTGVTVTVGEELGDVFALAVGASESYFRERLEAKSHLVSGQWFSGSPNEFVAGARVAREAKAKVGDELLLLGLTQDGSMSPIKGKLVGIFKGTNAILDQQILVPLERIQWLADIPEGATEVLVFGKSYEQGDALAKQLRVGLASEKPAYQIQSWSQREPWKSLMATIQGVQTVIVLTVVFLTALGIWNTMMMSVLERTHEIGVLRAMGLSRLGAVSLFVTEGFVIAFVGGLLGVALGSIPAWFLNKYGVHIGEKTAANINLPISEVIHGQLTMNIVLSAFGLGLVMAFLGTLVPAVRASSIAPVSAMRSGR